MRYKHSNKNGYTSKFNKDDYVDIYSSEQKPQRSGYVDIYSSERKKDRRKNGINWAKVFSVICFLIIGVVGCLMLYAYKTLHSFNFDDANISTEQSDDLANDSMVLNVLLIGSDSMSVGDGGRSDSMILLSLDARHKKIKLTSLMRDLWVTIPGYGEDRLNASYALGGPKLTIETIGKNFGILVDRYAVVDFEGFSNIIDTLGGVDLELTADECEYINKYSQDKHTLKGSGLKHLTGLQALHYSRDRNSIRSDYDRTSRQRYVLKAVVEKLKSANVGQITELISNIGPMITTNFKSNEISRMATHSMTYLKYSVEEFRLPTDDNVRNETYSQKMVLVINDTAKAKKDIYNFIYEPDPNSYTPSDDTPTNSHKSSSKSDKSTTPSSSDKNTSAADKPSTKNKSSAGSKSTSQNSRTSSAKNSQKTGDTSKSTAAKTTGSTLQSTKPISESNTPATSANSSSATTSSTAGTKAVAAA